MRVLSFESREEWMNWRLGKATGSGVKDIVTLKGDGIKPGVFKMVAESLGGSATINDDESAADRGTKLEKPAIERFRKETGIDMDHFRIIVRREFI